MMMSKQITPILVAVLSAIVLSTNGRAQQLQRHEAVAAYIYNFAKNVQWQKEDAIQEFNFVIFGQDAEVMREMLSLSKNKTIRNKRIKVSSTDSLKDCDTAHLVYITRANEQNYTALFDRIEGKNILLVSDGYADKRLIMINFIQSEKGTLRFEINKANIINQNILLMQDMILLGGTEVDVAALFREGQQSLRKLHKRTEELEGILSRLEDTIAAKTREIKVQKDSFDRQTLETEKQQKLLDVQAQEFKKQQELLASQSKEIKDREKDLENQMQKLREQQALYETKSRELKLQQSEIQKGNELLKEQQDRIAGQQRTIKSQSDILEKQGAIIHRQKSVLYLLITIMVLVAVLVLTFYSGYRGKQRLNRELEIRVAELAVARDHAESADRLKSAFLATMSHELRTPLNSIIGFTGIMLQGLAGALNSEQTKQLTIVQNSARHLLALINDVLDISKIEAGQVEIHVEPFDLRASVEKVVALVRPMAEKKSLEVRMQLPPSVEQVMSDRRRVEQVLLNLLNNAVKFTERGEVALAVEVVPDFKSLKLPAAQPVVRLRVTDTGIGIKPEDLPKLFLPFRQIDSGLSRQHEGTGLGLAICGRLAGLLGGEISVHSEWGKGSTFTFIFPVNRQVVS
jgi:signal transduction histidine kinase